MMELDTAGIGTEPLRWVALEHWERNRTRTEPEPKPNGHLNQH